MRTSKLVCLTSFAVAAIVILGICTPAYAQTGDCYATSPGCLDPNFGTNGRVTTPAGMYVYAVAVQEVGGEPRIIAVGGNGLWFGGSTAWIVVRYRADGSLDPGFGVGGIVRETFTSGYGLALDVTVQTDNKLVVVGYVPIPVRKNNRMTPAVIRYNAQDGSRDSSFGTGGMVTVPYESTEGLARAVTLQSDGKIVVAGNRVGLAVFRLLPNGALDGGFNGTGQYVHDTSVQTNGDTITIQKIGSREYIAVGGGKAGTSTVWRFTPEGALDTGFGQGGVATTDACQNYLSLADDPSNNRLLAGCARGLITIVAYDPSGNLDPSFGVGGIARSQPGLGNGILDGGYLALQPDGRILAGGRTTDSTNTQYFAAWRFLSDGTLDSSFGSDGWVTTLLPGAPRPSPEGSTLLPDGKFVVAGWSNFSDGAHASLARYFGYLTQLSHDIAVSSISASPSTLTQGDTVSTQVAVRNNGTNAETADVTLTETPDGTNLGSQSVSLAPGETAVVIFTWLTSTYTTVGAHTLLATATITTSGVTDEQPGNNSRSTTVSVAPAGGSIVLSARGYKVRGVRTVDLSWTGASAPFVDIYRNGAQMTTAANTGAYTDTIGGTGSVTYIYKVCDAGTTRCSNTATVIF